MEQNQQNSAPESPPQSKRKSWKGYAVIGLVALAIIGLPVAYLLYEKSQYVWTNDAEIEGFYVDLSPDILARIITLEVDEGDFVTKGQLISQLDDTIPFSQKIEAEAQIIKEEAEVAYQIAHFEKIRNNFIRAQKAIKDNIISGQEYDHHEKNFKMAEAAVARAESALELAKTKLGVINAHLLHTIVLAPRNGYIAKRWVLAGDVMNPGQTMFTMYDLENIWVLARLDEKKIQGVRIGDEVDISIDAYPDYSFRGKVFVIKGAAASQFNLLPQNNATGNYTKVSQRIPIKITIERPPNFPENKPLYLLPGMSAEVNIRVRS